MLHVRIKTPKTDPFRVGCTIRVAMSSSGHARFPAGAPTTSWSIIMLSDGSFLTRAHIQANLTRTFPFAVPGSLGTHSFRIGGASMLCSFGVPDATVQIMGRWSSNAFRRYLHISNQFCHASIALLRHTERRSHGYGSRFQALRCHGNLGNFFLRLLPFW